MEDYVKLCEVDIPARRFTITSDQSEVQVLNCDDSEQFMRVLEFVRATCQTNEVSYKY
jgi:hypothetical protein